MATGYVINEESRVCVILRDIVQIKGNSMFGSEGQLLDIDLRKARIVVVEEDLKVELGSDFPIDYLDISDRYITVSQEEQLAYLIMQNLQLEADNERLQKEQAKFIMELTVKGVL